MSLFMLVLFLHITTMFAAVGVGYGITTFVRLAYMTGQVTALKGVGMAAARLTPLIPVLFISGGLFGLLAAIVGPYSKNLLAPWLVIAYVLFVIAMLIGARVNAPEGKRLGMALRSVPDGPIPPEIDAFFTDQRMNAITVLDYVVLVLLIFDMVVKPFS
jgi:hypothetical protein